jgi:acyl-CoA reductase-like NAD-dependent aldehyde dehydrogenase
VTVMRAFDVISPVDETIVRTVDFADRAELDARVDRAHRAFAAWRRVAPGDRASLRVTRAWDSGNLSVNSHSSVRYWTPFGGFKQSGLGRELGPDAVGAFTETKNVFISTED